MIAVSLVTQARLFLNEKSKFCRKSVRERRTAGLSRELVPERLLESQDVAGCLLPDVAERWGLRPSIPVAAGAGDQEAGGVGMGVTRPGTICSTIGTSGVVFGCSAAPFIDPEPHGMYSQCHAVPGQYSFLGCTLGAGGSFKWMRDMFFAQQKEALAQGYYFEEEGADEQGTVVRFCTSWATTQAEVDALVADIAKL